MKAWPGKQLREDGQSSQENTIVEKDNKCKQVYREWKTMKIIRFFGTRQVLSDCISAQFCSNMEKPATGIFDRRSRAIRFSRLGHQSKKLSLSEFINLGQKP